MPLKRSYAQMSMEDSPSALAWGSYRKFSKLPLRKPSSIPGILSYERKSVTSTPSFRRPTPRHDPPSGSSGSIPIPPPPATSHPTSPTEADDPTFARLQSLDAKLSDAASFLFSLFARDSVLHEMAPDTKRRRLGAGNAEAPELKDGVMIRARDLTAEIPDDEWLAKAIDAVADQVETEEGFLSPASPLAI